MNQFYGKPSRCSKCRKPTEKKKTRNLKSITCFKCAYRAKRESYYRNKLKTEDIEKSLFEVDLN